MPQTQSQSVHIHIGGGGKKKTGKKRTKSKPKPKAPGFGGGGGGGPPQGTLFPIRETIREAPLALPAPPLAPMTLYLGYPPVQGSLPPPQANITVSPNNNALHRHETRITEVPLAVPTPFAVQTPPVGGRNDARRDSGFFSPLDAGLAAGRERRTNAGLNHELHRDTPFHYY